MDPICQVLLEFDNIADKKYAASGQVIGDETAGADAGSRRFSPVTAVHLCGVTLGLF